MAKRIWGTFIHYLTCIQIFRVYSSYPHVSPGYLSDLLKNLTGQSTQRHIPDKLIEEAKEKLSTTDLSGRRLIDTDSIQRRKGVRKERAGNRAGATSGVHLRTRSLSRSF